MPFRVAVPAADRRPARDVGLGCAGRLRAAGDRLAERRGAHRLRQRSPCRADDERARRSHDRDRDAPERRRFLAGRDARLREPRAGSRPHAAQVDGSRRAEPGEERCARARRASCGARPRARAGAGGAHPGAAHHRRRLRGDPGRRSRGDARAPRLRPFLRHAHRVRARHGGRREGVRGRRRPRACASGLRRRRARLARGDRDRSRDGRHRLDAERSAPRDPSPGGDRPAARGGSGHARRSCALAGGAKRSARAARGRAGGPARAGRAAGRDRWQARRPRRGAVEPGARSWRSAARCRASRAPARSAEQRTPSIDSGEPGFGSTHLYIGGVRA